MNSPCQLVAKYTNLLKPRMRIGTDFILELRVQRQVLDLVRRFGMSRTLSLISITGEIARLIQNEERVR